MPNFVITTQNRKTATIRRYVVRQMPHDKAFKIGKTLWGGKIIDIRPQEAGPEQISIECLSERDQRLLAANLSAFKTEALRRYVWINENALSRAIEHELETRGELGGQLR